MSTLAEIIDRVEADLKDTANATWTSAELTQHIRRALCDYSLVNPARANVDITPAAGSRQIDLSSVSGLTDVVDVWYPLDPTFIPHPPPRCLWSLLDAATLYLDEDEAPIGSEVEKGARVLHPPTDDRGLGRRRKHDRSRRRRIHHRDGSHCLCHAAACSQHHRHGHDLGMDAAPAPRVGHSACRRIPRAAGRRAPPHGPDP